MYSQAEIVNEILIELNRARAKFPTWPDDPIHAAGVVLEESGELMRATLQACYEKRHDPPFAQIAEVRQEAIQTGAMAIRFLLSIERYAFEPGHQHKFERDHAHDGADGPTENGMNYCDNCGRPVVVETAVSEEAS